jgi:hypothetical protein
MACKRNDDAVKVIKANKDQKLLLGLLVDSF